MSISNSLLVALILVSIVFIALVALSFFVKLQTAIISSITKKTDSLKQDTKVVEKPVSNSKAEEMSAGELTLIGVDEETAAMVMAITSDELQIPLNELQFKSIKALN